ncbi:MAG: hypothetical protein FD153_644 [Rhodospirillaceae bacterium]|nr:MAG: hypothetical protein FD153_644 [Rhodospirillaceae bacterium]
MQLECPVPFAADNRQAFREIVMSLRPLSELEAAAIQPLRVRRVVTAVKPGESVRRLAAMMPLGNFNEVMFTVLNGLPPGESLQTGRKVKVLAV